MRCQNPLAQRSQWTVVGKLSAAVGSRQACGVFERSPSCRGNAGEQVVNPIPPIRCTRDGRSGDDEYRDGDRLATNKVSGLAEEGGVRVVHGDGNKTGCATPGSVSLDEIAQRHELTDAPRRSDQ